MEIHRMDLKLTQLFLGEYCPREARPVSPYILENFALNKMFKIEKVLCASSADISLLVLHLFCHAFSLCVLK